MFARVATFDGIDIGEARETSATANEKLAPVFAKMTGLQAAFDLAKESGEVISIAVFDTAEHAAKAEPAFDQEMPKALGDLMKGWSGRRTGVEQYEVIFRMTPAG